jgi:hypothetical protein
MSKDTSTRAAFQTAVILTQAIASGESVCEPRARFMTTVEFAFSVPVILLGLELAALIGDLAGAAKRSPGRGDGDNERRGTASTQSGRLATRCGRCPTSASGFRPIDPPFNSCCCVVIARTCGVPTAKGSSNEPQRLA